VAVPPRVRIDLLGGFRLLVAGRAPDRLPSSRQQQLLAFLVLHARRGPVPRQRVSGALWPDSTDDQALTNLRRELHHLREGWPAVDALIDAGSRALAWRGDAEGVVDLIAFEAAAERGMNGDTGALQSAAALYHGDLMPDCSGEWIDPDRDRLRQRAHDVLSRLVAVLEGDRAYGDAIERAQQLLRIDPLDEQAWCALMRCHARRGDRAAALHTYQQCAALLKKELGVQPSAMVQFGYACTAGKGSGVPQQAALGISKSLNYPTTAPDWYVARAAGDRDGNGVLATFVGSNFTDAIYGEDETE